MNKTVTVTDFLKMRKKGQRTFIQLDFEDGGELAAHDLSGLTFQDCFMNLDFSETNLENVSFVRCNLKTADFSGAQMNKTFFKNCNLEAINLADTELKNIRAIDNYYFGKTINQRDFEELFDPHYQKPKAIVQNKQQALEIASDYLGENPNLKLEISHVVKSEQWIDGHRRIEDPVWIISAKNLEPRMEGSHLYSIVVGVYTGKIEDVHSV